VKGRLLVPAFAFLIVSAFALVACGSSENDEGKITSAIETAATSTDPADCETTQTVAFMEQSTGEEGKKEAVEKCEEQAKEGKNNPESVDVEEVEIEGEEATATTSFTGGTFDGQTLIVNLVEEEGDWKLNEAERFKNLDREKLIGGFKTGFEESNEEIEPKLAECLIEGIEESSDSELEGLVLHGSEGIEELAEECVK
jgi:ABC-type glycerol-3-phosphate transport system substrate-binding protein